LAAAATLAIVATLAIAEAMTHGETGGKEDRPSKAGFEVPTIGEPESIGSGFAYSDDLGPGGRSRGGSADR
jgi:hypothetical protein